MRQRPQRAPGVQLLGELESSGYERAPALIRREDGQIIKLTPLLYALASRLDGSRDLGELAVELSARSGKQVTSEDVGFLVEERLKPLGIVQGGEGAAALPRANPLLALRPRVIVTSAKVTRAITAPFTWLFHPVVMVLALAAFAALATWLLAEQGLSSALHQAFYEPGLILAVWALVIASAAFHEIGHAAACRYAGANPGVMGAGLYLVWPAFYTEVNDAYRLDRRSRLRVDLGGLYFSALFALLTFGVWLWTGADAVLLVIAVQLIQMVRQMAPFIRADGYHLVADAIGVPDLFAHIKPTLLRMLPGRRGEAHTLKPWARRVVALWVLITIPVLLLILGAIVLMFPRLAATAWDSGAIQWDEVTRYWGQGDPTGVAMSGISIMLVALPVAGVVYLVTYLAQRFGRKAWRETAGRPVRRALACTTGAALIASVAWAWWPDDGYRPIERDEGGVAPSVLAPPPMQTVAVPASWTVPSAAVPVAQAPGLSAVAPLPDPLAALVPRDEGEPPPAGPEPNPGGAPERFVWPFPFDPIEPARPGDNRALAVNVTDGSALWDFAGALLILSGPEDVDQANEAFALASCTECRTGAVAFQIILIVGYVEDILPMNAALALNYECEACETWAVAYQVVATLLDEPTREVRQTLRNALDRLDRLEARADEMSLLEILTALERIREEVLVALDLGDPAVVATDAGGIEPADAPESGGIAEEAPVAAEPDPAPVTAPEPDNGAVPVEETEAEASADNPDTTPTDEAAASEEATALECGSETSSSESGVETCLDQEPVDSGS